jgi:hypothetical protein
VPPPASAAHAAAAEAGTAAAAWFKAAGAPGHVPWPSPARILLLRRTVSSPEPLPPAGPVASPGSPGGFFAPRGAPRAALLTAPVGSSAGVLQPSPPLLRRKWGRSSSSGGGGSGSSGGGGVGSKPAKLAAASPVASPAASLLRRGSEDDASSVGSAFDRAAAGLRGMRWLRSPRPSHPE